MSKINKMSLKSILESVDLIIRQNDIIFFCDNMDVIKEFIDKYSVNSVKSKDVKEYLIKNEEYIDKEKLILLLVKNYKDNIAMIEERLELLTKQYMNGQEEVVEEMTQMKLQYEAQKNRFQIAKRLGRGVETFLTFYYYDEEEERFKIQVVDSREVIDEKQVSLSKNLRRFNEIDLSFKDDNQNQELGLEYALQSLLLTDLYPVFPTQKFGSDVRTMILENAIMKRGIKTKEELEELKTLENYDEYSELIDNVDFSGMLPEVKEALKEYIKYVDLDKMLLISAYRFKEGLEDGTIDLSLSSHVKDILECLLENIKNQHTQFSCQLQRRKDNSYENELVEFSIKDLKDCLSHFTTNGYVKNDEIEEYRRKIESKELSLLQIDSEIINIIFSDEELESLYTLSPENLVYIFQKYNWNKSKIIDLLETGKICLEDVQYVMRHIDLSDSISFQSLNTYYKQLKENIDDEKRIADYEKYLTLYKQVFITNKSNKKLEEVSSQVIEQIIEEFEGEEYNEAIKEYFKQGIITLDSIIDWSDENIVKVLFEENLISLEDMQELVKNQKLSFNYLSNIYANLVKNESMEYDERFKLLRSGYLKEEDIFDLFKKNLIFESHLLQLAEEGIVREKEAQRIINSATLAELEKNSSIVLTGLNSLTKRNNEIYSYGGNITGVGEEKRRTGRFIIDPNERERFIRLLKAYRANTDLSEDSPFYNYEFYVIPDESGTIGLNSVVIAERYYEDKDTETRFATDNATYFFKYKDLMVLSNLSKSEMTRERKNIVFTANHVIANDKREGRWARSVIENVAKTMLSSDLKEYGKKNLRIIVLQKLKEIYTIEELGDILDLATEIDLGAYIGEIESPLKFSTRKTTKKTASGLPEDISDDTEGR